MREVGKFATVGGAAFLDRLRDLQLRGPAPTGTEQLTAKTISTVIAATFAFIGNRFWTWRHREHSNPAREYALFFLFNAVGLGIGLACLAISHYWLGSIWPAVFAPCWPTTSPASWSAPASGPVPVLVVPAIRLPRRGNRLVRPATRSAAPGPS